MLTDLITKFSKLKEGELFVKVGESEVLLRKNGSRSAETVKKKSKRVLFAGDEVLTLENAKKYYGENKVGIYDI